MAQVYAQTMVYSLVLSLSMGRLTDTFGKRYAGALRALRITGFQTPSSNLRAFIKYTIVRKF